MVLKKWAAQGEEKFQIEHFNLGLDEVTKKIKGVIHDYRTVKKQQDRRENWIKQMIMAQAAVQNTTKSKLWKRLKQMEQSQMTARKVKQALSGKNSAF